MSLAADVSRNRHRSAYHSIVTKLETKATFRFTRTAEENKNNNNSIVPLYHSTVTKLDATVTFCFA